MHYLNEFVSDFFLAWIVENSRKSFFGYLNCTLTAKDGDPDTYKNFTIVSLNSTHAEIRMNHKFDFEVAL